jgi:hypothetical protein
MFSCDDEDVLLAGAREHSSKLLVKDDLTRARDCPLEEKASEEALKANKPPSADTNLIARSPKW